MGESLFISDLHLCDERPQTLALFRQFMTERAPGAEALYILGDLFEVWVGDDDPAPANTEIISLIRQLVDSGTRVYFMHGNRDFLIAEQFAAKTGCELLSDPSVVDLYGTPTLLAHGDALCTDDVRHQAFRAEAYQQDWKDSMLARPLEERLGLAKNARKQSEIDKQMKPSEITDVSQSTVEAVMRDHNSLRLIHGHTHRPATHDFELDGQPAQRLVLPEWTDHGGALVCDAAGCRNEHYS